MQPIPIHSFHIPVMGIAFTIDSPIKVAAFGINSTLSIIEDNLIETMRKYYYNQIKEPYVPIGRKDPDSRARRITDYLDLVNRIVHDRFTELKNSAFEAGSDLMKYFEMLPDASELKQKYQQLFHMEDVSQKQQLEDELRQKMAPGAIEVNIMTKVDKVNFNRDGTPIEEGSDALAALKGYAKSKLENSAIVFSAGMNPRLYNYLEKFTVFDAEAWGTFKKKVVIKVSDYRSALIQGKYLAKKGIWVSEFRIESGLNCGGHAFATQGQLLGPILEEFKNRREELSQSLFELYNPAIQAKGQAGFKQPHPVKITVQGGVGTAEEADFLQEYYKMDSVGWGTPFLLCPEATTVDEHSLELLGKAEEKDIELSKASPLGVRFHYLKGATAGVEREERIEQGKPGSPCTEKFLVSNTEFTKEPICTASKKYQKLKLAQLNAAGLPEEELKAKTQEVLSKECLCIGLSNAAAIKYDTPFVKKQDGVTVCPGPNIVNFSRTVSLREMADHIYGRSNIIEKKHRPHMFVKELQLYVAYLKEQISQTNSPDTKTLKGWTKFGEELLKGVAYYRDLLGKYSFEKPLAIERGLEVSEKEIDRLMSKAIKVA